MESPIVEDSPALVERLRSSFPEDWDRNYTRWRADRLAEIGFHYSPESIGGPGSHHGCIKCIYCRGKISSGLLLRCLEILPCPSDLDPMLHFQWDPVVDAAAENDSQDEIDSAHQADDNVCAVCSQLYEESCIRCFAVVRYCDCYFSSAAHLFEDVEIHPKANDGLPNIQIVGANITTHPDPFQCPYCKSPWP